MAWEDPEDIHDPTTGTSPPAAWGDAVRESLAWLAGNANFSGNAKPHARVYRNSNQAITTSTSSAISFSSTRYNVRGMWSGGAPTRLTVPSGADGVYSITGCVDFSANATGARAVWIMLNAATKLAQHSQVATSGTDQTLNVSCDYKLAAGDYVELYVFQTSGVSLNVNYATNYSPEFSARWVALG